MYRFYSIHLTRLFYTPVQSLHSSEKNPSLIPRQQCSKSYELHHILAYIHASPTRPTFYSSNRYIFPPLPYSPQSPWPVSRNRHEARIHFIVALDTALNFLSLARILTTKPSETWGKPFPVVSRDSSPPFSPLSLLLLLLPSFCHGILRWKPRLQRFYGTCPLERFQRGERERERRVADSSGLV